MDEVRVVGRAKINLFLRVLGKRDDGYHEIESVMQTVDLIDDLSMARAASTSVSFEVVAGLSGSVPSSPDLVEKAIGIFNENVGGTQGAHAHVTKRIPIGAGLGGGSADAAAALKGMAALSGADVPQTLLLDFAAQVGSDVPFALVGGTALVRGRGEILTPVKAPEMWWVLVMPGFEISTAQVYENFDGVSRAESGSSDELVSALASGDVSAIGQLLSNDLEAVATKFHPELIEVKKAVLAAGALGAVITGSGPTVAGLCNSKVEAQRLLDVVSPKLRAVVVRSATTGVEIV